MVSLQALKDLSTICPELVVAELFQRIEPAIQNIMKPSEVQNAISLASYVLPMLLRSEGGADTLSSVLGMTVAGIDTNDPMKTMYTLRLFNAIFSTIPLCDPKDLPASCSKPEAGPNQCELVFLASFARPYAHAVAFSPTDAVYTWRMASRHHRSALSTP